MTNIVEENYLKCFEWNVLVPKNKPTTLTSDFFYFQQRKCNFKLRCGVYTNIDNKFLPNRLVLSFESDGTFSDSASIKVTITCCKFTKYSSIRTLKAGSNLVWVHESNLRCIPLTFKAFFMTDILKETGATSKKDALEEKMSYLEQNIHFQALSRDFSKLLKEGNDSSDVTIICEGKTFHAHKNILQTRSAVLSAMLKSDMVEGKTGLIALKDIKMHILERFLQYLYTGCLPQLSMDNATDFYKVGDQYAVEELKKACSDFFIKNLSEINACELLVLADLHSDKDFKKKVIAYIVEKGIPKHGGNWSEFCERHCILAIEVLNAYITKH